MFAERTGVYTGWRKKKRPEHSHAVYNRVVEMNQHKSTQCNEQTSSNMSRNSCLKKTFVLAVVQTK